MEDNARNTETTIRKVMYGMIAVAVALAGALAYVWYERTGLVNQLNEEKDELTAQMIALQNDYADLSSDYETINSQLDSSREQVSQLIERIQKTEATNRYKIRQYEKELGTLRSVMRNYIIQIDSLNTLNKKLTADAAEARRDAAENRRRNEELSRTVETLTGQVAAGSIIRARGIVLEAYNGSGKVTDRSSRVVRLLTSLSLVENELAPKGPTRIFIVVRDPDGNVVTATEKRTFTIGDETFTCSASREVDYQGAEVELSIYLNDVPEYRTGVYTVEVYSPQTLLGKAETMLR